MPFINISDNQNSSLRRALISGHYTLLLGSGISTDSKNIKGPLQSAEQLRLNLCRLKGVSEGAPLQQVFSLLNQSEIQEHVTEQFLHCSAGPSVMLFPEFIWRRAFTFNIDDALEAAYTKVPKLQSLVPVHFEDRYEEVGTLTELSLVHLHGYVRQADRGYVFSRNQYIRQMSAHNPWMTILAQIVSSEPVIIIGSSLDELDLDYYLSFRTSASGRSDQGPSIYVSPNSDALTKHHCETHGMLQFVGTCQDFLNYCKRIAPSRPTPMELIPQASQSLLPTDITEKESLAFWSDFELVPGSANPKLDSSRFLYGHPPSWGDLAGDLDVARNLSSRIIEEVENNLSHPKRSKKLVVLFEIAGTGKTTILSRCAFEFAKRGITTLRCTSLSRLEPTSTKKILDKISGPIIVVVDNFADQVTSFESILDSIEKDDVVVLASERSYRRRYISQALSGVEFRPFDRAKLEKSEVSNLVNNYVAFGLVGEKQAIIEQEQFAREVSKDPIAVACCRILNDFRPLDRIVLSVVEEGSEVERRRYLMAALARHCFSGGVRYSVVASAYGSNGINGQFQRNHPLPLAFVMDNGGSGFVVPQNATLSNRILEIIKVENGDELLSVFTDLGNAIAPRVNRKSISQRSPEARLAGRLFDFDDVVEFFLAGKAQVFYELTQDAWQWNSRYWEQVAQLHLGQYHKQVGTAKGRESLARAIQHARHAVSIETHPYPLTTLAQTLIARMMSVSVVDKSAYFEALEKLSLAISIERKRSRMAVQPFVTLFRGTRQFLENGGQLSGDDAVRLRNLIREAQKEFPRDREVIDLSDALSKFLTK